MAEILMKTLKDASLAVFRWRQAYGMSYQVYSGEDIYGSLTLSLQSIESPFLIRTYDFYKASVAVADAHYSFKCVLKNGYFQGCVMIDDESKTPLGEYRDYFLNLWGMPRGRVFLNSGQFYNWNRRFAKRHWILSGPGGGDLLEFTTFKKQNEGTVKVDRSAFMRLPDSRLLLLFGLYLSINPRRYRTPAL